jgi:sec-independent protein translocase protein TatA
MFEGLFQPTHLLLIFGIALLMFGPKKLPELGKGIGDGIRGFKSAIKAGEDKPVSMTPGLDCTSEGSIRECDAQLQIAARRRVR